MSAGRKVSSTIAASLVAQQVLPKLESRKGLAVWNQGQFSIFVQEADAPFGSTVGMEVPPRSLLILPTVLVPKNAVYLSCSQPGTQFTIVEGVDDTWSGAPGGIFRLNPDASGSALPGFTGDVTAPPGSNQLTIPPGTIDTTRILDGTIQTSDLADGAITSAKILDGTIATTDLADGSITLAKSAPGSTGTAQLVDSSVTNAKLAPNAVTTDKILDGTIATSDIADGAITSAKILDGTIATADLADQSVATAKLADGSVTLTKQAQGAALSVVGNPTGATAAKQDIAFSTLNDAMFGNTRGSIVVRGATSYQGVTPGPQGYIWTSNGPGSDPSYQPPNTAFAQAPRSNVRQTAQGGPQSGGSPTFLPSTSASLTLTTQNIGAGVNALTVSAAQGYNVTGQNDIVAQLVANQSWTLPASTTSYLFINASTGALTSQTLQPIYQFGGAISTANGQFTFDYQAMIGYLGNGTTAVATPVVCVGEAVTNASAVTSTTAYAYNGFFTATTAFNIGAGGVQTVNHSLGVSPSYYQVELYFNTAYGGYSVGDKITIDDLRLSGTPYHRQVYKAADRITVSVRLDTANVQFSSKTSGSTFVNIVAAQNNLIYTVRRGWGGA